MRWDTIIALSIRSSTIMSQGWIYAGWGDEVVNDVPVDSSGVAWVRGLHAVLVKHKVRQVCHVPDGGNAPLIEFCNREAAMTVVTLTSEEEGIAMCCGAWLGGDRSAVLLQSSGVGNCINALSMVRTCAFPLLAIVSMRGEHGEFMPWQVPMGQATPTVLSAMGVIV